MLKGSGASPITDIIVDVQAVGNNKFRYTMPSGLTVESKNNRSLMTEKLVTGLF